MNQEVRSQDSGVRKGISRWWFLVFSFWLLTASFLPLTASASSLSPARNCQQQDLETLTNQMLKDLPSYANRVSQRSRRLGRKIDIYTYVLLAGRPEFAPLTLGPGVYQPAKPLLGDQQPQQIFFTTLERQYTNGKPVQLQQYHWLFLTQTASGWRLATMFSRTGSYPNSKPPTPPRESSDGVIAQAIETWLRDCRAETDKSKK